MFKRLIIPLDGSRLSEAVLPTAIYLAEKLQASVVLIHVIERNAPKQIHGEPHLVTAQEAEPYLADVQRRFFPAGIPVEVHVHTLAIADVARSIVDHALEFGSDLVMMCTHGKGGLRKLFFGSIAQQVAASRVPVLLVRPMEGMNPPVPSGGPILVPLDGTEVREAALPEAAELAKACGARIHLLMVVPTLETLSGAATSSSILLPATTQEMLAFATQDAEQYLKTLSSRILESGLDSRMEVRRGDAAEIIPEVARNQGADLIVMGTSARTGMNAFWSGSVSPKVSDRTDLPLLLIPVQES